MSDAVGFKSYWLNGVQVRPTKEQVEQLEATARVVPNARLVGTARSCKTCGGDNYDESYYCIDCEELVSVKELSRLRCVEAWAKEAQEYVFVAYRELSDRLDAIMEGKK